jgi:transposase
MHTQSQLPQIKSHPVIVGIDWADQQHVLCLIDQQGQATLSTLDQSPQEIDDWAADLASRFPSQTIAVSIEQSKGPLVSALLKYPHLQLYPINPKQLARYREAMHPSGSKDDPQDATLLAQFLKLHIDQLRPLKPDCPATRKLARLAEIRRRIRIVDERSRLSLQLKSALKQYFPLLIKLCAQPLMLAILNRWPTLALLKRVHVKTLRTFLAEHGVKNEEQQTSLIEAIRAAVPLTTDEAIVEPESLYAQLLARQILELSQTIEQFDKQIAQATAEHPDQAIFRSLPGAGDALVPRLIAAFGSDRQRFASAEQVQAYSGIAPVTKQSGKTRHVSCRHACSKFLRQTFHEFADQARKWSSWSTAFYKLKRDAGFKHQAAVRALAFKWIRIIFKLWKTSATYKESAYLQQLQKRNSPLVKFIQST